MSNLSWLNPTPHAIAVYASQPPSPVATQHSLPSGRYPLLGPDFHRLDRTSFVLAHSFDHLVGAGVEARWDIEPGRFGLLKINHQLELVGCLNWRVARLLALEDAIDIAGRPPVRVGLINPVGDEAAIRSEAAERINRWQQLPVDNV